MNDANSLEYDISKLDLHMGISTLKFRAKFVFFQL